jgi:hypothetical protein
MIRKIILPILAIVFGVNIGLSQVSNNEKALKLTSLKLKLESDLNYAKALAMAKSKNWSLKIVYPDGGIAKLVGVDDFGFPIYLQTYNNTIAAATTRANQLWPGGSSGLNLSGSSTSMANKLGIWEAEDQSPLATHVELTGRIVQKDAPTAGAGDHATHVAGTMIATGINPIAKGMAYQIPNLISYDTKSNTSEFFAETGLLLSNHSYGITAGWRRNPDQANRWEFLGRVNENEDYTFGYYSSITQIIDSLAFNVPNHLLVFSAGNPRNNNGPAVGEAYFRANASGVMAAAGNRPSGISSNDSYDIITHYSLAKNVLTVGAVNGLPAGYSKPLDVVMSSFSAWGPTDDGRIKPDLVANGVSVTSTTSSGNTSYGTLSGTSMSAPNTTGSLLLIQEYYNKLKPGTFLRSSTLKGLAIHTTDEAGDFAGPDYRFGWGLLNVERAASVLTNAIPSNNSTTSSDLVFENTLSNGQTFTRTVVATGKVPLKATICWTDPKGSVNNNSATNLNDRTKKLVNDLDIRITRGTQTNLPWVLDVANPAVAAQKGDNITDNVERIDVDSTIPGQTYTITVSHKGTLERGTQQYALIVSGVGGTVYCASSSNPGGGAFIDSVSFSNIRFKNTAGCKSYTNNTNIVGDIQSQQTLPITVRVATCDATTQSRMVKIFIDYNNNGVFDTNELVATSPVLNSTAQNYTTNITTPSTLTIGAITLMRIIVQETLTASDITACNNYAKGETQDYRLQVVSPTNDLSLNNIVSPQSGSCSNPAQFITVNIANNGSIAQSNIPLTVTVANGATTIATINTTYPGTIPSLSNIDYTFQTPFNALAGVTYTITARVNLTGDQFPSNNQFVASVAYAANPSAPTGDGVICNTSAILRALNPTTSTNYYWYPTNTSNIPFATGTNVSTTNLPTDRTYYLQKEARASVGAVSKLTFPSGGYNNFAGNFMNFTASAPLTIETVRLYIGNPGKVRFTLARNITASGTSGGYTYNQVAVKTIDVYNTRPVANNGALTENDAADSGAVYRLDLNVPTAFDYGIIVECLDGATIYRNNNISSTPYPFGVNNLMNFTGNSVVFQTGGNQNQFWYFFYDTRVSTAGCVSDRVPIVAAANANVTVSQVADSLVSSIKTGTFQWVYNDTATVIGGVGSSIKPTRSGNYKVLVTDALGCSRISANVNYTVTALNTVSPQEIKLTVSPNPNNGIFQLSFEVANRSDLSIEILNASGQRVFTNTQSGFIGRYNKLINLQKLSSEFYLLKIQHDKKTYLQKIILQR